MSHVAPIVKLTEKQKTIITQFSTSRSVAKSLTIRAQIILHASQGMQNKDISAKLCFDREMIGIWRQRWVAAEAILLEREHKGEEGSKYKQKIKDILSDKERPGVHPNTKLQSKRI